MHRTLALAALYLATAIPAATAAEVVLQPQVNGLGCLRPETKAMMRGLQGRIGLIEVTSTCGGRHARHSQHYSGRAIDFRPVSVSPSKAVAVLKAMPAVGGVGAYPNGIVHADVGATRHAWYGTARHRTARHGRGRQYAMR